MKKVVIISDLTKKSLIILKNLKKINIKNPFKDKILFIIIGGDGFMLKILKKKINDKHLFYGINSGNYGFLMNRFNLKSLSIKKLAKTKKISISPLSMKVFTVNKKVKKALAINEISLLRQSKQASVLSIKNKNKIIIKKLMSDGVLISTPAGSTAYNMSVYGPILELNSKKLSLAPISAFRPRRWKAKIISDDSKISINNLDINKRPVSATADNYEVRNIKKVEIKVLKKIKINLLYDQSQTLQKKIKLEQVKKEIY